MLMPPAHATLPTELPPPNRVTEAVRLGLQAQAEEALSRSLGVMSTSISEHFSSLRDPRKGGMVEHKLVDLVTIAVCAVTCGANNWVEVVLFGERRREWLEQFLELPHGIASHDTFGRVFARLSAEAFQQQFAQWMQAVFEHSQGEIIAIDGKCLRRSYDTRSNKAAIHRVSAWAQANRVVLGQVTTDAKSNEITAIPKLLKLLNIKDCIVTIDAMGCQRAIAAQIRAGEGDYVFALKGNQSQLHSDVVAYFEYAQRHQYDGMVWDYHETLDKGHGRVEVRRYWTIATLDWLDGKEKWAGLNLIGKVESERHIGGEVSGETRYYIASIDNSAERFAHAVRGHWSIENTLHWSLDVTFREDDSRIRQGEAAENFALVRHVALSLLQQEKSLKVGIEAKRFNAALDPDYLIKVLSGK
jgi:predicted transposase YbfD/YdcC